MRVILVDDEPIILENLKEILIDFQEIEIMGTYTQPSQVLFELQSTQPEVAFIDIEMYGMNGIELAEQLLMKNNNLDVVFVTAYNHYASEAFEVNAIDYLLKPIKPERVAKTIEKLLRRMENEKCEISNMVSITQFGMFQIKSGNQTVKWSRSKSRELLAYLLQNEGKWISKYTLCEIQWQDYEPNQALAYLQTSIYALRKNLKEYGIENIKIEYLEERYRVTTKNIRTDVMIFEKEYREYKEYPKLESAQKLISILQNDYLEDEDWIWADLTREYYRKKAIELKKELAIMKQYL